MFWLSIGVGLYLWVIYDGWKKNPDPDLRNRIMGTVICTALLLIYIGFVLMFSTGNEKTDNIPRVQWENSIYH